MRCSSGWCSTSGCVNDGACLLGLWLRMRKHGLNAHIKSMSSRTGHSDPDVFALLGGSRRGATASNDANVELKKPDLSGTHHAHADAVLAKAGEGLGFRSSPIPTPTGVSTGGTEALNLIIEMSAQLQPWIQRLDHCLLRYSAPPLDNGRIDLAQAMLNSKTRISWRVARRRRPRLGRRDGGRRSGR